MLKLLQNSQLFLSLFHHYILSKLVQMLLSQGFRETQLRSPFSGISIQELAPRRLRPITLPPLNEVPLVSQRLNCNNLV